MSLSSPRTLLRLAATGAVAAVALAAGPAQAAVHSAHHAGPLGTPHHALTVVYDVNGSSHVTTPDITVPLGPTTLTTFLQGDGSLVGTLPIPTVHTEFTELGLLDVASDVVFTQVNKAVGQLNTNPVTVNTTARYYVTVKNVTIDGSPADVGDSCTTVRPFKVAVATPAGQVFDLSNGGPLTGTYTLPDFGNCGAATDLVNLLLPGKHNTLDIDLSNGRILGNS